MQIYDLELYQYIYLLLAALFSYIIKGIAGFGNTLLMTPLFSFVLKSKQITPIDLLFSIPINTFLILKDRKDFSLKVVLPISILLLIGDVIGALFLQTTDDRILKIILSILIIGIAIEMGTRPKKVEGKRANPLFLGVIGVMSGITAGIFGISVLLIAYISRTSSSRGNFRSSLGFVFLIDNFFRLIYYIIMPNPIITVSSIRYFILLFPSVILGMFIGVKLEKRINEKAMMKILITILVSTGVMLFLQNIV